MGSNEPWTPLHSGENQAQDLEIPLVDQSHGKDFPANGMKVFFLHKPAGNTVKSLRVTAVVIKRVTNAKTAEK